MPYGCLGNSRTTTTIARSNWYREARTMHIKALFQKDIARSINGVVKADQLDASSVWQELDEFVVTRELDQHLRTFFSAYCAAMDHLHNREVAGKGGVWVSVFFGSGYTHYLK